MRFALRLARRNPGFTLLTVLLISLGVGANVAIYSVLRAMLLRPLPYPDAERLVAIWETNPALGMPIPGLRIQVSTQNFLEWQRSNRTLEQLGAYADVNRRLTGGNEPLQVRGLRVSSNLLQLMGVRPLLGRTFSSDSERVLLMGHGFWRRAFGADRSVVGRTLQVDGVAYTVGGVLAEGTYTPPVWQGEQPAADIWIPLELSNDERFSKDADNRFLYPVGRLKRGVSLEDARADFASSAQRLARDFPKRNEGWGTNVLRVNEERVSSEVRQALLLIQGAVLCLLLICCANIGNLLLARAVTREREFSIRVALGASRRQILRQLSAEASLLAVLGTAGGLLLAVAALRVLQIWKPEPLVHPEALHLDGTVLLFAIILALVCATLFTLLPGLTRMRDVAIGRYRRRLPACALTAVQTAIAVVLLIGSGLLLKSMAKVLAKDVGMGVENAITMELRLSTDRYPKVEQARAFYRRLMDRVCTGSEVIACGLTSNLPLRMLFGGRFLTEEMAATDTAQGADFRAADQGYFRAMGIPVVSGRTFTADEVERRSDVVIVDSTLARRLWPGQNTIGKRIKPLDWGNAGQWHTVVGVVGAVRQLGAVHEPRPEMTVPGYWYQNVLIVRTKGDPEAMAPVLRETVRSLDAGLPIARLETLRFILHEWSAERRTHLTLVSIFASLAMFVSAIGLYGVLAHWVAQRNKDIGIRMALGAGMRPVLWTVLAHGLGATGTGLAAGVICAAAGMRAAASMLFEVEPIDVQVYGSAAAVLFIAASMAALVPARRALSVDPAQMLRAD
jgi:putative ABC transport system permease protein